MNGPCDEKIRLVLQYCCQIVRFLNTVKKNQDGGEYRRSSPEFCFSMGRCFVSLLSLTLSLSMCQCVSSVGQGSLRSVSASHPDDVASLMTFCVIIEETVFSSFHF